MAVGGRLLVLFGLLALANIAQAVQYNCSQFPVINGFHTIDGDPSLPPTVPPSIPAPDNIKIDADCRIRNYSAANYPAGINTNFSFVNNDPTPYLVIFDNVFHTGNMSCNSVAGHKIWFTNGSSSKILSGNCQSLLIPVEMIDKRATDGSGNVITSATVGVPFTYSLAVPVLFDAGSGTVMDDQGSLNDISKISIRDDISLAALGVDLTYLGHTLHYRDENSVVTPMTEGADYAFSFIGEVLGFDILNPSVVPAGAQIFIDIEVVLNDSPANAPGSSFINIATWEFAREIDGDFYDPLPGENGRAELVTISQPNLILNKTSLATAINFSDIPSYTLSIQNAGGFNAWNIRVEDELPLGMCEADPTASVTAQVLASDNNTVLRTLDAGAGHYVVSYDTPTCLLEVVLTDSAGAVAPTEYLRITYTSQLDPPGSANEASDGDVLTNVAAATQWYNDASTNPTRIVYNRVRTNGTPGTTDHEDAYSVTAGLTGYYFEKVADNLTTGAVPTQTATPGDRLRYRIRLFNLDQIINGITITDQLDLTGLDPATVVITTCPVQAICDFNAVSGVLTVTGDGVSLDAAQGSDVSVFFEVDVLASAANGYLITNQADLQATDGLGDPFVAASDDPNINGVADPDVVGDEDPTVVQVVTPGPLSKINPAQSEFAIGEQFTYRITVPETPVASPLYDVRILDDLSASGVDLGFVSATVMSGGTWVLTNTGTASNLVIENVGGGIDIPANGQVVIDITVELLNTINNQSGDTFTNTASYTYNRANGDDSLQRTGPSGPNDTTAPLTIIEPDMTISKTVANVTPGKAASDPAAGGDILEYTLTMPNTGNSTAYDVSVRDILPEGIELIAGSATAQIGGNPVVGFIATPTEPDPRVYVWGSDNGDDNFDVPVGESLVLTFQVNVTDASVTSFDNSALVDWTSLPGGSNAERTGADCPLIIQPDDYCAGPAIATITTVDTTALAKSVLSDSWDDAFSTAVDGMVRVGDTVTYRLALTLREGLTSNVVLTDTLPTGLEFDAVVAINGETVAPYTAIAPFSHSDIAAPAVVGNVITWTIGDIYNSINNDTSDDVFVIDYRARVLNDTLTQVASTTLGNAVSLSYDSGVILTDSVDIEVRQPVMVNLTKTDQLGNSYPSNAAPLEVDIATDVMQFTLEMCNEAGSTAPAYNLQLIDTLASELDETSIANLQVTVNGVLQTDGVDYLYTPPAMRGGEMDFILNSPVAPGQCAQIQYDIGFHTDVAPNQLWNNSVMAAEYWSLPTPTLVGQQYAAVGPTEFWMTNTSADPLPLKTLISPAAEATIGEAVIYQITIPAINAARNDVEITDTLPEALVYDGATVTLDGNPVAFTDNSIAPDQVSLLIAQIPAGQEAIITLSTYVANTIATNAGDTFTNTATYTYSGYVGSALTSAPSDSITLVEPDVTVVKAVAPMDPPVAGDVLTYTVELTASAGANFSDAYDLVLTDTLSLGLAYVAGSATVGGVPMEPSITGDGVTLAQTLVWTDIDVAEGATVTLIYDVEVQNNVTPGQVLANTATATWTSLSGINPNERDGSGGINDYIASDSTNLGAPDNTTFAKSRLSDTFNPADNNVRVGDRIEFELRIGLQEGTHNDLLLEDTLPAGLVYEGMVSADFFGTPGVADPVVAGQTLTWDFGTVINPADGDPSNDFLVIVYSARVDNEVLPHTPTTQPLFNSATLDYTVAGVPAPTRNDSVSVNVLQPNLAITKAVTTVGGDNEVVAGETITYTVEITNNGDAPAYDVVLVDTLPAGLRQSGILSTDVSLVSGAILPSLAPTYDSGTGVATWNFDDGNADTYTIPVGDTLRVVYTISADADIGASLSLDNLAQVTLYYSFDNDAVPAGGVVSEREVYGPTNTASATVTTPGPGALEKVESASEVVVGEQFTYRITVPAVPVDTALFDVRILDDLATSTADLRFVSVVRAPATPTLNTLAWTPVNTGNDTQVVIEDTTNGIDIPAGEQIAVDITVEVLDTATNVIGLVFSNSADYTYNSIDNDATSEAAGLPGSAGDTTIIGPDTLVMNKSGPATLGFGPAGSFTLDLENTSNARAWDITITDLLPNPVNGGMCQVEPVVTAAQVFANDGVTPVSALLVAGVDFSTAFIAGSPTCTFAFTGESAAASLAPGERLIITYDAWLDDDNPANIQLTNIAGATEWFSQDTAGAGATGETRTYSAALTDGTPGTDDHQDAWTLTTEPPELIVDKTAFNVSTGLADGTARPGDTLRYTITITNSSQISLPDFSLTDDLGALNAAMVFQTGTLGNIVAPVGADTSLTNPVGGTNGAGLLEVRNLALGPQGSATETVVVEFEVTLVSVIDNGTVVYNQGELSAFGSPLAVTDDPSIGGAEDPTEVLIVSSPQWRVEKISEDLTGDPSVLEPGDVLRYTLTVANIGDEHAVNVMLTDAVPAFTSYVSGSTTLNGAAVADAAGGASPLVAGILINAPVNTTPGFMPADATAPANHVATITFRVVVDPDTLDGTVISNQGFVAANGVGGTVLPLQPSDDPNTDVPNDPTRDIVGALPLLNAQKTVALFDDVNGDGIVNPGDTLRYTITISNSSNQPATDLVLNDPVPADTTYVSNSITVDGAPYADGPGLPASVDVLLGTLAGNSSVVVEFDVVVNPAVPSGTVISNQGVVDSAELPARLTDADGIEENGFQPTTIVVGSDQQLSIIKSASVVGGGVAQAGSELEYLLQITNTGAVAATDVTISDDLNGMIGAGQASFVVGSATMNGGTAGISYVGDILTADYSGTFGNLAPGASISVRFRVLLDNTLVEGDVISNTGTVFWNNPALSASSSVNTPIGAIPGVASLTGTVWHDANFNSVLDTAERRLAGWTVRLLRGGSLLGSTQTDSNGIYRFNGVAPSVSASDLYTIEFRAPGAGLNTAMLGMASSAFTNDLQRITDINAGYGVTVSGLDLPIDPNGVVYDAVLRAPIAGATLVLVNSVSGNAVSPACFDDSAQQGQVTLASGYYKFDLNFSDASCPTSIDYLVQVTPPGGDYTAGPSMFIPPLTDADTAAYSVPTCSSDAIPGGRCEAQLSEFQPPTTVAATDPATGYYLHLSFGNAVMPDESQIFNNHIPVDPTLANTVSISKTAGLVNVSRGQLVPYVIKVRNTLPVTLTDMNVVDVFPAGFKYVAGSARLDDAPIEPTIAGRQLSWNGLELSTNAELTIKVLLIVGGGVSEGEYVNRVQVFNTVTGAAVSPEAIAAVRVVPDPTFDCTDIIGKVFDDANLNGTQDEGEQGLPGVRLVTARGLIATTDQHGRYHITCAAVPDENRGSNFILKIDDRSLPTGYRVTTENPRVQRITRGKMAKFNFGAALHRVVRLDMAHGVFEPNSTEMRLQWRSRLTLLMKELEVAPSILRLAYMAENEPQDLVDRRLQAIKDQIKQQWAEADNPYELVIETEVFWRTGAPPARRATR